MKIIGLLVFLVTATVHSESRVVCENQVLSQLRQWGVEEPKWRTARGSQFFFVGNTIYNLQVLKKKQLLSREDDLNKTEITINQDCSLKFKNTKKSELPNILKRLSKCSTAIESVVGQWPELRFEKGLPNKKGVKEYYKASSGRIGEWYFITASSDHLSLMKKEYENLYVHEVDNASCEVSKKVVSEPVKEDGFTDKDLQSFADTQKNGAIYIWSPKMEVAIRGMKNFVDSMTGLKVSYKILLDIHADLKNAKEVAKKNDLPTDIFTQINSEDLIYRNVLNHFPTTVLVRDGKVVSDSMHGYLKKEQFDTYFYNNGL